ncbi:MAG: amino acid adenylation domain-containing protein, partial [Cystobacter sp.]
RLWFLDQLESHSAFYNMHVSVRLEGRVDLAALEDSVEALAERHEVLRTRLVPGANGELLQEIAPDARRIRLDVVSLLSLAPEAREARAREVARGWIEAPFDLRRGPLLRAHLCELSETESLLFVVMHHAVSDGGSLSILTGELAELYEARVAGRTPELAPLPLQYADYAAWQRRSAEHGKLETQLTYWKKQLAGELPVLELPRDGARPPVQRYRGTTLSRTLPLSLRERLRSFSTAAGVTPFMTLMAAYQVLLHRLSGQDEVLVGTPISGRASRSTEGLIGCFLNTLVIRTRLRPDEGFRAVLDRVRDTCLEAYAHQDVPFEKLVEALQPVRSTQHTPLFQTMLVHHTHSGAPASFGALRTSPFELEGETSTFDLTVTLIESGQDFLLRAELDTDLFEPEVVTTWLEGFEVLLNSALAHPDRALTALAWVPEAWRARMLRTWNTTAAPHEDVCVHALIEDQAARRPDAVAVRFGDGALSYGELNRRANQLAHGLRRQGVGPDSVVAVVMERGLELFVGMLGVLKAGGAYLPIDPVFPRERMGMMLEDSRTPLLLTQAHVVPRLPAHGAQVVVLGEGGELLGNEREDNPDSGVRPSHLAYVIYTSGSTGRPKGAMVEHRALVNYAHVTREDYGFTASDRVLQFSSISWDVSTVEEIFPALTCGATLVVRTPEMLDAHTHFWAKLRDERITTINLPTAFWHEVVANLGPSFVPPPSLRLMVTGGERALPERALAWARHMPASVRLVNTYGVSEAASVSVLGDLFTPVPVDGRPLREVSLGRVIRNSGIYILDARLEPVPVGAPGELFIAGLGLGRGYLNQPELTATRFVPDPFSGVPGARLYRTGDVARYLPDGSVQYVRRADTQVKIRGYRVEPGEVESSLRALSGVRDAVVLAREDSPGHRRLVAYVVPSAGASPTAESLREALAPTLPEYMLPAAFVFLEALPVTDTGKVDRRALPAPAQEVGAPDEHFIAPRDALEQQVAEIWRELLGVARVGVRDNFFELGGHSLLAVRLLTRIRERLNRSVPLASLFQDASLEHMVQSLRQGAEREALLVPMSAGRDAPPFFCVHPWEGSVFCYRELAQALEGAVSFLGVQARGVDRVSEPLRRIEDMAALYVAALREAQPEGPYRLGGWSMGGLIAFEMARQLTRAGAEVSLLALIDAPAPATGPGAHDVPDVRTLVEASPVARQWIEGVEDVERALLLHRRHLEAMNDYRADGVRFEGRVLYVQASESPPREADGWKEHCPRLEVRTVNATHHSLVLETDTARLLSEHIRERL